MGGRHANVRNFGDERRPRAVGRSTGEIPKPRVAPALADLALFTCLHTLLYSISWTMLLKSEGTRLGILPYLGP